MFSTLKDLENVGVNSLISLVANTRLDKALQSHSNSRRYSGTITIYVPLGFAMEQHKPAPPYVDPAWVKEAKILKQEGVVSKTLHSKDLSDCITLRNVSTNCNCREDRKN
jgi:hypothetical protein